MTVLLPIEKLFIYLKDNKDHLGMLSRKNAQSIVLSGKSVMYMLSTICKMYVCLEREIHGISHIDYFVGIEIKGDF